MAELVEVTGNQRPLLFPAPILNLLLTLEYFINTLKFLSINQSGSRVLVRWHHPCDVGEAAIMWTYMPIKKMRLFDPFDKLRDLFGSSIAHDRWLNLRVTDN